jgi:hypothetical protein
MSYALSRAPLPHGLVITPCRLAPFGSGLWVRVRVLNRVQRQLPIKSLTGVVEDASLDRLTIFSSALERRIGRLYR